MDCDNNQRGGGEDMRYNKKFYDRIVNINPGTAISHEGSIWIKMKDDIDCHIEDMFFCIKTGDWKHASNFYNDNTIVV